MLDNLPLSPPVPSWNDLFLRFADADAANAVLIPAGYAPVNASIDTIGIITKTSYPDFVPAVTAEREVEGLDGKMFTITEVVTPAEYGEPVFTDLDGWHVNVRLKADQATPANLEAFKVAPANPVRVWA